MQAFGGRGIVQQRTYRVRRLTGHEPQLATHRGFWRASRWRADRVSRDPVSYQTSGNPAPECRYRSYWTLDLDQELACEGEHRVASRSRNEKS
jgi:hypothetical protein